MRDATILKRIFLYDDPDTPGLDIGELAGYLIARLPAGEVACRRDYITHHLERFAEPQREALIDELVQQLEGFEIDNLVIPEDRGKLPEEPAEGLELGTIYEATGLQAALKLLLPQEESGSGDLHLVFSDHCIADWDTDLRRARLRIASLGQPTVISTCGLIEAPAKPKQYHFLRTQMAILGADTDEVDIADQFSDRALGYGDPRLNEALKGYVLKAAFYRMFNEATCRTRTCRLFDARTQEDVITAQIGRRPGLCEEYGRMLVEVGGENE